MILRRVISHFRKQEWTAIAIDFLIVVVGVFVGIQVSNWNETRKDRRVEYALLQRLHIETQELLAITREEFRLHRDRVERSVPSAPCEILRSRLPSLVVLPVVIRLDSGWLVGVSSSRSLF